MDLISDAHQRALLTACPVFSGCGEELLDIALADPGCWVEEYPAGQTLYQPDRFRRCLGVLLDGSVQVSRDALIISMLSPGELFGAAALFNDLPDYATTLTARTACRALLLEQALVSRLMDTSPRFRDNYIRYLSARIRFLSSKLRSLAAAGTDGKLIRFLLTRLSPDEPELTCPPTQLASRLGISRASLYRAFQVLEERGLIVRSGKTLRVTDFSALESCLPAPHSRQ